MVKRKNRDKCISTWAMATALMLATTAQAQTARNSAAVNDTTTTDSITTKEKELGEVRVTGMIRRNTEAAVIAATNSSAHGSAKIAVDYTAVKNVKKMPGGKPGMVVYEPYYTAYVAPDEVLTESLRVK